MHPTTTANSDADPPSPPPRRDWAGVLPTQKLPGTNLATPESFIPIDLTDQKLTNIFQNMESH